MAGRFPLFTHPRLALLCLSVIIVLICFGLIAIFGSTFSHPAAQQGGDNGQQFTKTAPTTDGKFTVTLTITTNSSGSNTFQLVVKDNITHAARTDVGVVIYTTMLDMDMGTDSIILLPDGKGHFSASQKFSMKGHWQARIQIHAPDITLHEVTVKFLISA